MKRTTATNTRNAVHKYYKIDDFHQFAAPAGRCMCGKITDITCDKCSQFTCENHLWKTSSDEDRCEKCKTEKDREITKKERKKIKKAEWKTY